MALERLKSCDNIIALSEEMGGHRRPLYKWRDQLEPIEDAEVPPANSREPDCDSKSRDRSAWSTTNIGSEFFKGALQKIEARRQSNGGSGERASTNRSEK
jgi:hypothetical protein